MKIAVVGPTYPYRGGIVHYTSLLAFHLGQQYDMRLYGFQQQYPNWLFPGRSQLDPSPKPLVDVEARRWLIPWWPPSWRRVVKDWQIWKPDMVVIQWWVPFTAPMTAWLIDRAHQLGVQVVMICHNVLPHERSRIDASLIRLALRRADRLIVHSSADRDRAQTLLPDCSVEVVSMPSYASFQSAGWTRERARAALKLNGNILLFFGLVRPYKGVLDLLESLPQVLSKVDVTLLIVGEIWGKKEIYQDKVKTLGLLAKVQFIDRYVSNDEVAMYFAATDLAVLPYREATGSAVLQLAFGLGVPVVATRTGGMSEAIEDGVTGFLVEPGDVDGLARSIHRFFRENRAAQFRRNIAHRQNQFDWQCLIDGLSRLNDRSVSKATSLQQPRK